ncbi:TonB-dependent receptor [Luteimonas sp. SX5]|uniref:TonB-dependent receptor n=1 Tax=Luteimonas galliterrae TaxID=2940486 RepID=A0ABT0MGH8_9GAMM|nr:TonB-dependent receptor [Luteimonas galliterrae]MCL1633972.1 TonB-dependent receptor [Luteimonas galliterrae]
MPRFPAFCACLAAFVPQSYAVERTRPQTLDTVVVTATRGEDDALDVPAAIDRIDAEAIRRAQPRVDLSESLQRVPGVMARDRQNQAQDLQISVRGFGTRASFGVRGVRLYTDGIPATMPDGQGQVSHFALEAAERIEVLRGPFSALYGNSSGGVIQSFSAPPPLQPELAAGFAAGSDGLRRGSISWRGPWQGGQGGYRLDAGALADDGYRDHSRARRDSAQLALGGMFGADGEFRVIANALDLEADDPQGLTREQVEADPRAASEGALRFDTRKTVRQQQLGARVEHGAGIGRLGLTAYGGGRDTVQFLSVPPASQANPLSGGGVIDLDRSYGGIDARWQWQGQLAARPFSVAVGAEYQSSDEHRLGYENFVGAQLGVRGALRRDERDRVAAYDQYLQADWAIAPRWRVDLGVRRSRVAFRSRDAYITSDNPDDSGRVEYARTTPVAGVLFHAAEWLSLYANAGKGFETPTFNELSYRSDGLSGLNTALLAARSENVEAGVRARRGDIRFGFALFRSDTEDELVVAANQGGRSTFANAARSRRQGAELSWSGAWSPRWRYGLAYTWLDARYRDAFAVCGAAPCATPDSMVAAGNRIPGLPRHNGWAELRWLAADDYDFAIEARGIGRVYADDANTAPAPGYVSFDLSAQRRWRIGGFEFVGFARIDNLFDRDAVGSVIVNESNGRYFEPAPGRRWLLGLDIKAVRR